jgi:ribosomal protein S27AE
MGRTIHATVIIMLICGALSVSFACGRCDETEAGDVCPECGDGNVIPIVYGKPGNELIEKAERGEVKLGGCVMSEDSPHWHCAECGNEW